MSNTSKKLTFKIPIKRERKVKQNRNKSLCKYISPSCVLRLCMLSLMGLFPVLLTSELQQTPIPYFPMNSFFLSASLLYTGRLLPQGVSGHEGKKVVLIWCSMEGAAQHRVLEAGCPHTALTQSNGTPSKLVKLLLFITRLSWKTSDLLLNNRRNIFPGKNPFDICFSNLHLT